MHDNIFVELGTYPLLHNVETSESRYVITEHKLVKEPEWEQDLMIDKTVIQLSDDEIKHINDKANEREVEYVDVHLLTGNDMTPDLYYISYEGVHDDALCEDIASHDNVGLGDFGIIKKVNNNTVKYIS